MPYADREVPWYKPTAAVERSRDAQKVTEALSLISEAVESLPGDGPLIAFEQYGCRRRTAGVAQSRWLTRAAGLWAGTAVPHYGVAPRRDGGTPHARDWGLLRGIRSAAPPRACQEEK
jgi:hypothetical protein